MVIKKKKKTMYWNIENTFALSQSTYQTNFCRVLMKVNRKLFFFFVNHWSKIKYCIKTKWNLWNFPLKNNHFKLDAVSYFNKNKKLSLQNSTISFTTATLFSPQIQSRERGPKPKKKVLMDFCVLFYRFYSDYIQFRHILIMKHIKQTYLISNGIICNVTSSCRTINIR